MQEDIYTFELKEATVKIRINNSLVLSFNQLEYLGLYSYKDNRDWYGIDIYMKGTIIETYWNSKEKWLKILELLDKNL